MRMMVAAEPWVENPMCLIFPSPFRPSAKLYIPSSASLRTASIEPSSETQWNDIRSTYPNLSTLLQLASHCFAKPSFFIPALGIIFVWKMKSRLWIFPSFIRLARASTNCISDDP